VIARPGIVWALPGVSFFAFFAVVPMALVAYLSFTHWDGISAPQVAGLDNWSRLLGDRGMGQAVQLSLALTLVTWLVQTPPSLLIGVWAAGRQRARALLSAIFFLPLLLSSTAVALLWKSLFDPNFGLAAEIGPFIGARNGSFIGTSRGAFVAVAFVAAWQFIPFHTLLYQAATRQIPRFLYQAAEIDGAGRFRQFWHITLPQLRNTITTSSVLMVVGSLTFFDTVLILTQGGPGTDTTIVPFLMYRTGFVAYELGYASAIAFTLVAVATGVSLLLVRLTGFGRMRSTLEGV
jgi:xylobiose transport system permease protein